MAGRHQELRVHYQIAADKAFLEMLNSAVSRGSAFQNDSFVREREISNDDIVYIGVYRIQNLDGVRWR